MNVSLNGCLSLHSLWFCDGLVYCPDPMTLQKNKQHIMEEFKHKKILFAALCI